MISSHVHVRSPKSYERPWEPKADACSEGVEDVLAWAHSRKSKGFTGRSPPEIALNCWMGVIATCGPETAHRLLIEMLDSVAVLLGLLAAVGAGLLTISNSHLSDALCCICIAISICGVGISALYSRNVRWCPFTELVSALQDELWHGLFLPAVLINMSIPASFAAVIAVQSMLCYAIFAIFAMQSLLCNCCYAIFAMPSLLCNCCHASCAILATQYLQCKDGIAKIA